MEKKFNFIKKLDFNDIDMTAPEKVISDILDQLSKETNGIICGKINAYNGPVMSYAQTGFSSLALAIGTADKEVDIQNDLFLNFEPFISSAHELRLFNETHSPPLSRQSLP